MKLTKITAGLLALGALAIFAGCASGTGASETPPAALPAGSARTVFVGIDGMVCNFCATNIDKTLAKLPGVSAVSVNLDAGAVILRAGEFTPSDADIRKAVKDAGFEPKAIKRTTEEFDAAKARLKAEALKKLEG